LVYNSNNSIFDCTSAFLSTEVNTITLMFDSGASLASAHCTVNDVKSSQAYWSSREKSQH